MQFTLKLADMIIEIDSRYIYTKKLCKDYLIYNKSPDFKICVSDIDLQYENIDKNNSLEYIESICIYRKIAEQLPLHNRVVMHGASITYKEDAFVFVAPSGTGKTTHIKLWRKFLGNEVDIINGDKPILHFDERRIIVYGTPWSGKEGWQKNRFAPLKAICILKQGKINKITKIDSHLYLSELLTQIYLPTNASSAEKTLQLFNRLIETIPIYLLECDISEDAVKISFEELTEKVYSTERRFMNK